MTNDITFKPGQKITLFDKNKQKYLKGELVMGSETADPPTKSSTSNPDQFRKSPQSPEKALSFPSLLLAFIMQLFKIYFLLIHKLTMTFYHLVKQRINAYPPLNY